MLKNGIEIEPRVNLICFLQYSKSLHRHLLSRKRLFTAFFIFCNPYPQNQKRFVTKTDTRGKYSTRVGWFGYPPSLASDSHLWQTIKSPLKKNEYLLHVSTSTRSRWKGGIGTQFIVCNSVKSTFSVSKVSLSQNCRLMCHLLTKPTLLDIYL